MKDQTHNRVIAYTSGVVGVASLLLQLGLGLWVGTMIIMFVAGLLARPHLESMLRQLIDRW